MENRTQQHWESRGGESRLRRWATQGWAWGIGGISGGGTANKNKATEDARRKTSKARSIAKQKHATGLKKPRALERENTTFAKDRKRGVSQGLNGSKERNYELGEADWGEIPGGPTSRTLVGRLERRRRLGEISRNEGPSLRIKGWRQGSA